MDKYTKARLAAEEALQNGYRDAADEAQKRMLGAAALDNMERSRKQARDAQRSRQNEQESRNRESGSRNNW